MRARVEKIAAALGGSLWFLPAMLALCGIAAALLLVELDRHLEPEAMGLSGLLFGGGPDGARAVLSAVASSMMTVTGVTFSITVVALTLASQQYTPRVLGHFTADRGNQVVLGTFIATFVYCLLVLRTVRQDGAGLFVPHGAVTVGVLLALTSLAMLIYFIHHVAVMIQPSSIVERVAGSTEALIDRLFPERSPGAAVAPGGGDLEARGEGAVLPARCGGYVQTVDLDTLSEVAASGDVLIRVEAAVGEYVPRGGPLVTVWPPQRVYPDLGGRVDRCFVIGRDRTMQQDPEFGIIQLSDIAVKALSPGINDPTTAMTCLDFLGAVMERLGARETPPPLRTDRSGRLRVITRATDFGRMADLAFSQIRRYAEGDAEVTLRMARVLGRLARVTRSRPDRQAVVEAHLAELWAGMGRGLRSDLKRRQVEAEVRSAWAQLTGSAAPCPGPGVPAGWPAPGGIQAR